MGKELSVTTRRRLNIQGLSDVDDETLAGIAVWLLRENHPEESIPPMQMRPVNFPVEERQLLTQRKILCRECCSGDDQTPLSKKRAEMRTISVKQTIEKRMSRTIEQNG